MQFSGWDEKEADDVERRKRLAAGYVTAAVVLAGVLAAGAAFGSAVKKQIEDEVNVKFVAPPPEAKPAPPPPPPPPPPKPKAQAAAPKATAQPVEGPPKEMPKERVAEGDPTKAVAAVEMDTTGTAVGSVNGVVGGTGKGGGGTEEAAPAKPAPPVSLPEEAEPPRKLFAPEPPRPDSSELRALLMKVAAETGKAEVFVIVKFEVSETGAVENVRVLRGHPALDGAVVDTIRTWRYAPATVDGKPIRVFHTVKIPYRIRT